MPPWHVLLRVAIAGVRSGAGLVVSAAAGVPAPVRRVLTDQGIPVFVETDEEWLDRMSRPAPRATPRRTRGMRHPSVLLARGSSARPPRSTLCIRRWPAPSGAIRTSRSTTNEVTTAGRLELLPFLREQSITVTAHRFGNVDGWSDELI